MYQAIIVLGVVLLTQIIKKYIYPKWGATGVHLFAFILSLIGVVIYQFMQYNEVLNTFILKALEILTISVGVYEILLSKIGFPSVQNETTTDQNTVQPMQGE